MSKTKNMLMSAAAAVILVALNLGVFFAAGNGTMSPIQDLAMWGAFVTLNIIAILWAVGMLGLQPLVVSLSYVVGGVLAYVGVRDTPGVGVAEITTAGATYGAFGALAIGNATTKVRLAFFNKGQVPFIFIILGLLVLDAVVNSQVTQAGAEIMVKALVLPFSLAGLVIGLIWSLLNRVGIGKSPKEVIAETEALEQEAVAVEKKDKIVIPMPESAKEKKVAAKPAKKERVEPLAPAAATPSRNKTAASKAVPAKKNGKKAAKKTAVQASAKPAPKASAPQKQKPKPVIEPKSAPRPKPEVRIEPDPVVAKKAEPKVEEPIKEPNILDVMASLEAEERVEKKSFDIPVFETSGFEGGKSAARSDVMVQEPAVSVEKKPVEASAPKAPISEPKTEVSEEKELVEKEKPADDFLSGHLDLLNKLK